MRYTNRRGGRITALVAGMLTFVAVVSGCGATANTSSSSSAGGSAQSQASGSAASGSPIVIGTIGSQTGPGSIGNTGNGPAIDQAWAKWLNAHGGINGHPVKVITFDDTGDPAVGLQMAKELVQDKAIADVGPISTVQTAFSSYLEQHGIPIIGGNFYNTDILTNSLNFPSGTVLPADQLAVLGLAKKLGFKNVGFVYCAEAPICTAQVATYEEDAKILGGIKFTPIAKVTATQPSYTPECIAMQNDKVDLILPGLAGPTIIRLLADCRQEGFNAPLIDEAANIQPNWLTTSALNNTYLIGGDISYFDDSVPGVQQYNEELQTYAPQALTNPEHGETDFQTWVGFKLFEAAAKAGGIGPNSTPADLINAMYKINGTTLGGLTVPLTFVKGQVNFESCYYSEQIVSGKLVMLNGSKTTCLTPAEVAALKSETN